MLKHLRRIINGVGKAALIASAAFLIVVFILAGAFFVINKSPRLLGMFASGAPGSAEGYKAIDFAHDNKIDLVFNYSALNSNPQDVAKYLAYAKLASVKVAVDLTPFVDPGVDPGLANQKFRNLYGSTPDDQVSTIVRLLNADPSSDAVWGYFVDERPANSAMLEEYEGPLRHLVALVKQQTSKPVLASIEHGADDLALMAAMKSIADTLMMDYYPYPEGPDQTYGKIEYIRNIARNLHSAFGNGSWQAVQAFSYYVNEPDMRAKFAFPETAPQNSNYGAPTADIMTEMARTALEQGVRNIALFHYDYASRIPGQLTEVQIAARQIRALPEFG